MKMRCPHCKHWAIARTTRDVTRTSRTGTFMCTNAECGHTFVCTTEVTHTLSPSATPDPAVLIPLSSHIRRDMVMQQFKVLPSAAYQPQHSAPANLDLFEDAHDG
jgi:hypothetical protein